MRIDLISIFPDYFAPLELSLAGKARSRGLLDVRVHDLRRWTDDAHGTVDDTPYGGGAGMVMRPEPWGAALDEVLADGRVDSGAGSGVDSGVDDGVEDGGDVARPVLVVPTPSGPRFDQASAARLAGEGWLVVACGRYEGIDERVLVDAERRVRVERLSLGDYVLNGGEVAALAVVEAVSRLLPGFVGNPESLAEESHAAEGLLEAPAYTRPRSWRGLEVPEVLLSGDHARIAAWRHQEALRRTAQVRPDLLHPSRTLDVGDLGTAEWRTASRADAGELLTLQRACWLQEALANDTFEIPALHETLADVEADLQRWTTFVLRSSGRLVASVRGRSAPEDAATWEVGRLMVAPDLQRRGLGRWLLERVEEAAPPHATRFALVTGAASEGNHRRYRRSGYRLDREQTDPAIVRMHKPRRPPG